MAKYFVLDVETANANQSSLCQIGVVLVLDGVVSQEFNWIIDPEDWFDPYNVGIHGIDASRVEGCPNYRSIHSEIKELLSDEIVVHHTAFDKNAMDMVAEDYGLDQLEVRWLDSARVVRRVFDEFRLRGYGLANLAKCFDLEFKHHDAVEDAKVTALILEKCLVKSDTKIEEWVKGQFKRPKREDNRIRDWKEKFRGVEGNVEGEFYGEVAVFTGKLSMTKSEVATIAADKGVASEGGVNGNTTILVVGIQNPDVLKGYSKSSKHRKAEKKISEGQDIKIMSERDFWSMLGVQH